MHKKCFPYGCQLSLIQPYALLAGNLQPGFNGQNHLTLTIINLTQPFLTTFLETQIFMDLELSLVFGELLLPIFVIAIS